MSDNSSEKEPSKDKNIQKDKENKNLYKRPNKEKRNN